MKHALNRTILELKPPIVYFFKSFLDALNRTILELKPLDKHKQRFNDATLNRTILELKLKEHGAPEVPAFSQSHHFGIETAGGVAVVGGCFALNRTILELKPVCAR